MAKINIPSVNDRLLDKYIRHSVWMEQLKAGEAAAISRMLKKDIFPELYDKLISELGKVKNLNTVGSIRKIKRIKQMMASVEKTATAGAIRAGKLIDKKMYDVAKFEAKWNVSTLEKTVPLDISLNMPSNTVLKQLVVSSTFQGHRMQTWMKGYSKSVQVGIAKQLKIGVATGESLPTISKRLRKVLGQKANQAETLARTAVSNIVHDAREATFKANKKLIRKVQWVATLDDKTTLICINLDGKVFDVGEGERPPAHFNCRSTSVPVVTSWNEFGVTDPPAFTRASMNGAVPAKTNYRQWLKRQSKSTQIKVLGKKRQALYASGKVKIDRFVGKDYKPLTLKQLARREGLDLQPAPPKSVKAVSTKGTGELLTRREKNAFGSYSKIEYEGVNLFQRGKIKAAIDSGFSKSQIQTTIKNMDSGLKKLPGFSGTTYRGLVFETDIARQKFLSTFSKGKIWKSKSFQSTTKSKRVAKRFAKSMEFRGKGVNLHIDGVSGRDISKYSDLQGLLNEQEVLFKKGTPFKVTKIKGNEVWLKEVTKQSQLKPVPAPSKSVRVMPLKNNGIDLTPAEFKMLEDYSWDRNSHNVVRAQLGLPSRYARKDWNFAGKKEALLQADRIEVALKKMDGFDGSTYRGIRFSTSKQKQTFLDQFRDGTVWSSKSFQSTSKSKSVAEGFMKEEAKFYASKNSVMIHIKGKSGRDLNNRLQEVLYMKNTPFKVTKIKGNEIWIEEITDASKVVAKAGKAELTVTTSSKVGTTFAKTTSKEFQDAVTKQIDSYPENVKVVLNKRGITFNAGSKTTEMYPDLKGTHPRGWPAGTTWDSVDGLFRKSTNEISVSETYRPIRAKKFVKVDPRATKSVLNHETGHAFDWATDGLIHSAKTSFRIAYEMDVAKIPDLTRRRLRYFLQKGGAGRSETFADVFADAMGAGSERGMGLSLHFPNCRKYVDGLLKE